MTSASVFASPKYFRWAFQARNPIQEAFGPLIAPPPAAAHDILRSASPTDFDDPNDESNGIWPKAACLLQLQCQAPGLAWAVRPHFTSMAVPPEVLPVGPGAALVEWARQGPQEQLQKITSPQTQQIYGTYAYMNR